MFKIRLSILCLSVFAVSFGQHKHYIEAKLVDSLQTVQIQHKIEFTNTSNQTLQSIFLMDWANAFSSKSTPLAVRFAEDYRRAFHYASSEDYGYTDIDNLKVDNRNIPWNRPKGHPDIIQIKLLEPLSPNSSVTISAKYKVKIPNARFTKFGNNDDSYQLRYWHLATCAFIDGEWVYYSHKNLNDFVASLDSYQLRLQMEDSGTKVFSNLKRDREFLGAKNEIALNGNYINNIELDFDQKLAYYEFDIGDKKIVSDIPKGKLTTLEFQESILKAYQFATSYYGEFPQEQIFISYTDYLKQPVYGFTQLPKGFHPFKEQFKYEIMFLKQLSKVAKSSHFVSNLRNDQWFTDAIQINVLIKYIETYYPNEKIIGKFSKVIGLRWFYGAKLDFNDQYYLGYLNMSSRFLNQSLTLPKDSLLKFNYNISNPYKAGLGLNYLAHYDTAINLQSSIHQFYKDQLNTSTSAKAFLRHIKTQTTKDISWFENGFLSSNKKVDIKIKKTVKEGDSIRVFLKNNGQAVPIKLNSFSKKEKLTSQWLPVFDDTTSINVSKKARYFALDFEEKLPEKNRRNNYWDRKSIFHKPLQLRILQDIENPKYHQTFVIPVYDFNVNDGLILGTRIFNKGLFYPRNFNYSITPSYGLNSNAIQGSASIGFVHQLKPYGWSFIHAGISGRTESFAPGLLFTSYTPSVGISYRPKDFRSNLSQSINLRLVSIERESSVTFPLETPNYRVLNARYGYSNPNLTDLFNFNVNYELASNFSKLATTLNFRKLLKNNQWIDFRVYAGAFLFNDTQQDGDFFSFALDRPTDYLFDFNYLGRQESSNFVSQQFISAEGNFKSRLNPRFANRWITTASAETSIWKWVMAYSDIGLIKNAGVNSRFLYDSGIKLNLVQDYLELYFPMQSSLGFEPSLDHYDKRIRFKFSVSINTLVRLFTREWY